MKPRVRTRFRSGDIVVNTAVEVCGVVEKVMLDGVSLLIGTDEGTERLVLEELEMDGWQIIPTLAEALDEEISFQTLVETVCLRKQK